MSHGFHLAGIIPVAGPKLDFNLPWHDCLMPIAKDYLAIERSVLECAYAGCETIWVICDDDMQPLIRHRLGDYVNDPVWVYRHFDREKGEKKKLVPIQYVPIHPRDKNKRDCYGWSILYGAKVADKASKDVVFSESRLHILECIGHNLFKRAKMDHGNAKPPARVHDSYS